MRCKCCKKKFEPRWFNQKFCLDSDACISAHLEQAKKAKKKTDKESLKTRSEHLNELQVIFNTYIRERDKGLHCISCLGITGKKNAGHYRSVGSCPELRFNELNVHLQCEKCNSYLSGNLIEYRRNLIKKIGLDEVERLEGSHPPLKLTTDEIKELKIVYKNKIKELKEQRI